MNDEQMERVVAICLSLELAIAHLVTVLDSKGVASRAEIAASFRSTAMGVPQEIKTGPTMRATLIRIAKTIEHSNQQAAESASEIRKLLH